MSEVITTDKLPAASSLDHVIGLAASGSLSKMEMSMVGKVLEIADLNEIDDIPKLQVVYRRCLGTTLNGPSGISIIGSYVEIFRFDGNATIETLHHYNGHGAIYHRARIVTGAWSAWKKIDSQVVA